MAEQVQKVLNFPQHPEGVFVRKCQECGHTQIAKDPATMKGENWRELKCRRCKSIAMDYGSYNVEVSDEE